MARKSLSSQVIEEVDRASGLLRSVVGIVDPMSGIMIETVLESLHRIESMCIAAMQTNANAVTAESPLATAFGNDKLAQARHKAAATTKRNGQRVFPGADKLLELIETFFQFRAFFHVSSGSKAKSTQGHRSRHHLWHRSE